MRSQRLLLTRTKSAPHRAVRGKGAHRTEANPAPGTPAPLSLASSPGLWQAPELPGRSRTAGSTAQHHGQLNSAPWTAPLGTAQHHGQLRSAPRAALFSTMVSSCSAPLSATPAQAPRAHGGAGSGRGLCQEAASAAPWVPSPRRAMKRAPKGWAGSRPYPALQEMHCSDCHWSFGACLFRLNAGKETWIRKYSPACDFITGTERSIRV